MLGWRIELTTRPNLRYAFAGKPLHARSGRLRVW